MSGSPWWTIFFMDCKNKTTKKCSDYRNETSSIFFLHQCFNIYLTYTFSDNSCLTVWLTGIWTPLNLKLAFSSLLVVGRSEKKSKHEERRLTLLRNHYEVTWTGKMPINHLCGIGETILWMCVQSFNIHVVVQIFSLVWIFLNWFKFFKLVWNFHTGLKFLNASLIVIYLYLCM